jgi:hypothetical protein
MSARITTRLALSALVVLSVLASASPALASVTGHIGQAKEGGTLCYGDRPRVVVNPPYVASSAITNPSVFVSGGMYGGGFHAQRVSYQAFLYYWNAGLRKWLYTGVKGPLYTGTAYQVLQPVVWDNNEWGGTTVFNVSRGYYYAVHFHLNWHADNLAPGGTWEDWSVSYEGLGAVATRDYCGF